MLVETFAAPGGELLLRRVPDSRLPLRAWDRADELLIQIGEGVHDEAFAIGADDSVAIIGDGFGALTCSLRRFDPVVCIESAAGREALGRNLANNGLQDIEACSVLDLGEVEPGSINVALVKIPKSISGLRDALERLRPALAVGSRVIAAGMDKHLPGGVEEILAECIGPSERFRATGRARHFAAVLDPELDVESAGPVTWKAHGATLVNHGGGFSPTKLDVGTDFLLNSIGDFAPFGERIDVGPSRVVDLGSGNGVIGLRVAHDLVKAGFGVEVTAIDDSALAVDATKLSWRATTVGSDVSLQVHHAYRMAEVVQARSVDLIVVNPPFHVDRTISDETAWSMFVDAHRALVEGGALVVVGNRHLAYHAKLAKIFGGVEAVASNKRFVVHVARRT